MPETPQNHDMRIVFIGAGNVATSLAHSLHKSQYTIQQVMSRNASSASALARHFHCPFTARWEELDKTADIYLLCVTDNSLPHVISDMPLVKGVVAHTSGSTPLDVCSQKFENAGVLYPFQSFSKFRLVDMINVPLHVEGNTPHAKETLKSMGQTISGKVSETNSAQRMAMHVCGIFANNFTNHMYALAYELAKKFDISFDTFFPLIDETAEKIKHRSPKTAQTGPAVRNDSSIMEKHRDFLSSDPEVLEIYTFLSESIRKFSD